MTTAIYMAETDSTYGAALGYLEAAIKHLDKMPLPERARDEVDMALGVLDALNEQVQIRHREALSS